MITLPEFTYSLLVYAASNSLVALPIALLAWTLQMRPPRAAVAHALWCFVLIKLLTPPMFIANLIPTYSVVTPGDSSGAATSWVTWNAPSWPLWIAVIWIFGSTLILIRSIVQVAGFNHLLFLSSCAAESGVQQLSNRIARRLGLKRPPMVIVTTANISPMTWWRNTRPIVCLPNVLLSHEDPPLTRMVIAHELGHIARRDHLIRCLEWAVSIVHWWNPLAWWARAQLRETEEICCDASITKQLKLPHREYASQLVSVLEMLSRHDANPPLLANRIHGSRPIERRIKMIIRGHTIHATPKWQRNLIALGAAALSPMGLSFAQNDTPTSAGSQMDNSEVSPSGVSDDMMVSVEAARVVQIESQDISNWHEEQIAELEAVADQVLRAFQKAEERGASSPGVVLELEIVRSDIERRAKLAAAQRREKANQVVEVIARQFHVEPAMDDPTREGM